ncbi:MAG: hypothetical protein ABIS50_26320 [Luteolibacter sp.]|uniref:hypothetical protein n=1 Tax=Luteolibacter sp. TaxID=1962973 RepID=UPI0032640D69
MSSGFSDPNNHVPEVTPDDDWGDSDGHVGEINVAVSVLPPRRSVADRAPTVAASPENGLRIESSVIRNDTFETPRQLKVQEINGSVVRLEQEDSAPPRVERIVTFHEKPARLDGGKNPRGEGREWGRVHGSSPRWLIGTGAGIAALIVLGMYLLPKINATNAARKTPGSQMPLLEEDESPKVSEQLNWLLERQPEAIRIYRSFTQAAHFDEIIPMIRDGAVMKDTLAKSWQPMTVSSQWAPADDSSWIVVELAGHSCGLLEGNLPDHSKFAAYFINDHNRLLLDWKATTAYGTATFKELESGPCDGSEIRGVLSISTFYTANFPEADYQSFSLASPDEETAIWCYASRSSRDIGKIAQELQTGSIITEPKGPKKMTLRLKRGPEGALPNQWLIEEMLHVDWVSP